MVVPKSTLCNELCKQVGTKLRMKKKPIRVFVVTTVDTSKPFIVDLRHDLSGIDDGTTVYVTSQEEESKKKEHSKKNEDTTEDNDSQEEDDDIEKDPLEQVKEAYAEQERQGRRNEGQNGTIPAAPIIKDMIDHNKVNRWASVRVKLPAANCRAEILNQINSHEVTVLSGQTGSGKSTQVPQFILEDDDNNNDNDRCRRPYIVVTQPRRVAAISLATRVAEEMGSPAPGETGSLVGYIVRLDRRMKEDSCRIIYCTVGVLLRMLICPTIDGKESSLTKPGEPSSHPPLSLDSISHLILDEVHERDVNTDFSLTLLRGFLASKRYTPRLVLMSATASVDFFMDYFASATTIPPTSMEIPGRTFPVQINWLSECETFAGTTIWQGNGNDRCLRDYSSLKTPDGPELSLRAPQKIDNKLIRTLIGKIVRQQQAEGELKTSSSTKYRETGAILVFLPGRAEIEALARCLYDDQSFVGDRDLCKILKLYSALPRSKQQIVFRPAAMGTVKIVLATNIAETSVTIPDVTHVIDTGRVKESRFNASTRIKELVTVWTSKASLQQRSGRAGRTSRGVCWRLFSQSFHDNMLLPETAPEMTRTPLDELILQICLLYEQRRDEHQATTATTSNDNKRPFPPGVRPVQFLSKTPSPPPKASLSEGCRHLLDVDALRVVGCSDDVDDEESYLYRLTPLGYHLSRLPMDAKVGKILIIGCVLGCLDGALTVAAALSCTKSCFLPFHQIDTNNSNDTRSSVQERLLSLVENGFGGKNWMGGTVKGDLIAAIAIFRAWKKQRSDRKCWEFCKSHGLDNVTLKEIDQLRNQFLDLLGDAGFIARKSNSLSGSSSFDLDDCNQASEDALLTSCCLVGGLYPNVCTLMRPRRGGPRGGRLVTKEGDVCRPQRNSFQRNRVQQAAETGKDAYAVYHSKQTIIGTDNNQTTATGVQRPPEVFLTEVNFVSRFALILFGGDLEIVKNAIIVDGWLKFKVDNDDNGDNKRKKPSPSSADNAVLILAVREVLDQMILEHVLEACSSPERKAAMMERHQNAIQVVRMLLSEEG
jgi:HrpA-like RNA helicase